MPRRVVTVRLDPEECDRVQAVAKREGITPSDVLRRAIKTFLDVDRRREALKRRAPRITAKQGRQRRRTAAILRGPL